MSIEKELQTRAGNKCELCTSEDELQVYYIPPVTEKTTEQSILICSTCHNQIENPDSMDANHWRCLNDSMWSATPAAQVMSWRLLHRLKPEGWPADLLDMMYLDDESLTWAKASGDHESDEDKVIHKDSNGVTLQAGDSVVLTKDLDVKGSSLTAKRGTAVRNISLVYDNAEQIEGKVDGQQIVILTKFVKKNS